jgi:hypothetical protein
VITTGARDQLLAAIARPSYTPARRDVGALVALLAGDDGAAHDVALRRALARAPAAAVTTAVGAALAGADDAAGARLVAALGAAAEAERAADGGDPAGTAERALGAALVDPRPRVRRAAIGALGKLGGVRAAAALCARWDAELDPAERRAAAAALGKVGGDEARRRLAAAAAGDDAELDRRRRRGLLMIERDADQADEDSQVALDVAPPAAVAMIARCRPGLETIVAGELHELGLAPRRLGPGAVGFDLDRPLALPWQARTILSAGALVALPPGELGPAIVAALTAPANVALLTAWTRGPIRWRLDVEGAGHRRALAWEVAGAVGERAPALRNRPRATTWDVVVTGDDRWLELRPRRLADARFGWRVADVPAASHPTVAAALARLGGARDGEQVWDPFVGSGAELCERGRLGPCTLHGSDLDPRALAAARANLTAAGLVDRAKLIEGDALAIALPRIDLVITNPPMGRRLRGDVAPLLAGLATRLPSVMARGGRLVWLNPRPAVNAPVLERGGLRLGYARDVDLGGYEARLERWDR